MMKAIAIVERSCVFGRRRPWLTRKMATSAIRPATRTIVCVDFDMTITTKDTIALLFDAARGTRIDAAERAAHEQQVHTLVTNYMQEMAALGATILRMGATILRISPAAEAAAVAAAPTGPSKTAKRFDETGLRSFLDAFAHMDLRSIERVIDSKTLSGMDTNDLASIADRVTIMDGCAEALAEANRVCVISSNWSQTMIDAALRHSVTNRIEPSHVQIIANELKMDKQGRTTGDIDLVVQSPFDKALHTSKQRPAANDEPAILAFIGDSTNDLWAMLEADVGITLAFAAESTLSQACHKFGIDMVSLSSYSTLTSCALAANESKQRNGRIIFTAASWGQVHTVLAMGKLQKNKII